MRAWRSLLLWAAVAASLMGPAWAQNPPAGESTTTAQTPGPVTTVAQAIDRIIAREHDEIALIRRFTPLIETYIQDMKPDKEMGIVPVHDHYFLGQADLSKGVVDKSMLGRKQNTLFDKMDPLGHLAGFFSSGYVPEGFLQMIYLDTNGFDRQHYQFDYVRREFLGEVRCYVFDLAPLPHSGRGRFKGRVWVEDHDFTIVRFNGVYTPAAGLSGFNLPFDSWRLNLQPGMWLPAYIYSQESDLKDFLGTHVRFRSQTRLWGYDLKNVGHESEFSALTIESPNAIQDQSAQQLDPSPVEAERAWQHQAEQNVLDRLQHSGLTAPHGQVDKILETVVNNLEVTNSLDIEPEVHCRVLLTSTLESFSIGHTIVISRGLLDVLPDEASLATVLAQELANIILTNPSTDRWGFNYETNISTVETVRHFSFQNTPHDLEAAANKAVELLKNSPYKDKLGNAGLFLKQLEASQKSLPALINPRLGNRVYLAAQLVGSAPQLEPSKLDQIAALPIGARIKLDPWSDQVEMMKSKGAPLLSAREKMPFEVTPFMPYLTRYGKASPGVTADPVKEDMAKKEHPPQQQQPPQPQ